jgi:protein TonB
VGKSRSLGLGGGVEILEYEAAARDLERKPLPRAQVLPRPRPEPAFAPETSVISNPRDLGGRRRSKIVPFSLVAHVLGLGALVLAPAYRDAALPEARRGVKAFLVEPGSLAPPPPPPPPAPRAAPVVVKKPIQDVPKAFVAPVAIPDDVRPEGGVDLGQGSIPGGIEGGVPGGVVGGVVGGIQDAPLPAEPVRVGGSIKEPRKIKNVPPEYPLRARNAGVEGMVILECLISPAGRVQQATVVRSVPLLDEAAVTAVKQWIYTPTLVDGAAVPVIMMVTVRFGLK